MLRAELSVNWVRTFVQTDGNRRRAWRLMAVLPAVLKNRSDPLPLRVERYKELAVAGGVPQFGSVPGEPRSQYFPSAAFHAA